MSKALARRRRLAHRNPLAKHGVGDAISTTALFGLVGGGIGAAIHTPRGAGAVAGAQGGLALLGLGGLVVALVSKPLREQALVTTGVSLGGVLLLGAVGNALA